MAEYVVNKTKEIIGEDNIIEYIEPSAGSGVFLNYLPNGTLAYDIEPEDDSVLKQDYLTLDLKYKQGRCIIGNPPFGDRCNLYRKFYNKSCCIANYISFISPIKLLNNTRQNYKFNLIYSEDLGEQLYSKVNLHCCLNIYEKPSNGLNKKINNKLKAISIYREDDNKYDEIQEDFKICRMGCKVWKVLDKGQDLRNFKIVVNDKKYILNIIEALNKKYETDGNNRNIVISTPYIVKDDIYKYIKEQILEIE